MCDVSHEQDMDRDISVLFLGFFSQFQHSAYASHGLDIALEF